MDRTLLIKKIKGAATGKLGMAAGFVSVGAIALTVGMHFGQKPGAEDLAEESAEHAGSDAGESNEKSTHAEHESASGHEGASHAARSAHETAHHESGHEETGHEHAVHEEAHETSHSEAAHSAHASESHEGHPGEAHAGAHTDSHGKAHEVAHGGATHKAVAATRNSFFYRILGTYIEAWRSIQEKADQVRMSQLENERLRLENSHLRLQLEGLQFNGAAKEASTKTQSMEYKLDKETGSHVGRDLASIAYRVPTHLVPGQLYTLGISYFKAREDEKAAVIFTFLTGLDDNDVFRSPKNFLLTGIAWYRLDNFATAERYFDRALKAPEKSENLQTLAHARMWKALVASRTNKHTQSQFWLTELIDHHPLSLEASWVNSKGQHLKSPEAQRGIASEE